MIGSVFRSWPRAGLIVCLVGADSTGGRNTLVFFERWSVDDEISDEDVLHEQAEVGDVGSVGSR